MNRAQDVRSSQQRAASIESGHFVLTMMPSLYCALDCPHCYLSKEERRDTTRLSEQQLDILTGKIAAYYQERGLPGVDIHAYQYGGEPTSMGIEAFSTMLDILDHAFPQDKGYRLRHTILSALVGVDLKEWIPLVMQRCGGYMQSSYDGRMRGGRYVRQWDTAMRTMRDAGVAMGTVSVVNSRLLEDGPINTLNYLAELGVVESSFLPFMENLQNEGKIYNKLAPTMAAWSQFMIALSEEWITRRSRGEHVPEIGQMQFVLAQAQRTQRLGNIAGQTLFLLPNGDYALPDYATGWKEYMRRFGNGLRKDFAEILASPPRRAYLRKQVLRNTNPECQGCPDAGHCVMEFWKQNRPGDDCFGGRQYVAWVLANQHRIEAANAAWIGATDTRGAQRAIASWLSGEGALTTLPGGIQATTSLY